MNLGRTLLSPWLVVPPVFRWTGGVAYALYGVFFFVDVLISIAHPQQWFHSINWLAFLLALTGVFFLSVSALVMRGARQWRLAGVQRDVATGAWLYAIISIGVPTVLLALLGAPWLHAALVLTIGLCGGLLYSLAPRWIALPVVVLWMVWDQSDISASLSARAPWVLAGNALLACVAVLAVLAVWWAWRRTLFMDGPRRAGGMMATMLGYPKSSGESARAPAAVSGDFQAWAERHLPIDMRADLRGTGPRDRVRSMRVALGGLALKRGRFGRLVKALPMIATFVSMFLVFLAIRLFSPHGQQHDFFWQFGVVFIGAGFFVGALLVVMQVQRLRARWRRTNSELPLLALLPGLGDPSQQRSALLRAALGLPLSMFGVLLGSTLVIAISLHFGIHAWLWLSATQLGFAAMLVAFVVCIFGDRLPTPVSLGGLFVAVTILSVTNFFALVVWHSPHAFVMLLAVLWTALGVTLWVIAWRGWLGFRQRPHPFLANAA